MTRKLPNNLLVPLLAWDAIVASSIALMYALTRSRSIGPEGKAFLIWTFIVGLLVVLSCWPVCRVLRRVPSTLAGLGFGLLIPIVAGWFWATVVDPSRLHGWPNPWNLPWGLNWGGADAWVSGLVLSIPSCIAGGIVGFLQARNSAPAGRHPGES